MFIRIFVSKLIDKGLSPSKYSTDNHFGSHIWHINLIVVKSLHRRSSNDCWNNIRFVMRRWDKQINFRLQAKSGLWMKAISNNGISFTMFSSLIRSHSFTHRAWMQLKGKIQNTFITERCRDLQQSCWCCITSNK